MTQAEIKLLRSLNQQKFRKELKLFIIEGDKSAKEWMADGRYVKKVFCTQQWYDKNSAFCQSFVYDIDIITTIELSKISQLTTPNEVLLLCNYRVERSEPDTSKWIIGLDTIQDPGNLGTIIRTADWFGIEQIVCSQTCADQYNSKVLQATMGSWLRVEVHYVDLEAFCNKYPNDIFATSLSGNNINDIQFEDKGLLLMGNESKGLNESLLQSATHHIRISKFGKAESLNVAVATGIICDRIRK